MSAQPCLGGPPSAADCACHACGEPCREPCREACRGTNRILSRSLPCVPRATTAVESPMASPVEAPCRSPIEALSKPYRSPIEALSKPARGPLSKPHGRSCRCAFGALLRAGDGAAAQGSRRAPQPSAEAPFWAPSRRYWTASRWLRWQQPMRWKLTWRSTRGTRSAWWRCGTAERCGCNSSCDWLGQACAAACGGALRRRPIGAR